MLPAHPESRKHAGVRGGASRQLIFIFPAIRFFLPAGKAQLLRQGSGKTDYQVVEKVVSPRLVLFKITVVYIHVRFAPEKQFFKMLDNNH